MGFLKQKHTCDNCGNDLSDTDEPIKEDGHEFCSQDCRDSYEADHDHDEEDERDICQFC